MRRTNINLGDIQWERLDAMSRRTGLKKSELVRRAVDEYLDREERKALRAKREGGK
ncbi:ribbon-helix-helix domain-containing protein [bacterium]|nr:ribbon-helix-helix domain-containing protein [bacterium]